MVADTGSSDGTPEILRACGVQVHAIEVWPWRFDVARNMPLDLLPADIDVCLDVCLSIDLDEVPRPGWREAVESAWKPGVTRLRYLYNWKCRADGASFWADKIHARHGYRWRHPVHEVPTPSLPEVIGECALRLDHLANPNKLRSSYLALLELAVQEDPKDDRCAFYLGREYMFYGHWEKSIGELMRYLSLPRAVWKPERAAAMRFLARAHSALGRVNEPLEWLLRACAEAPGLRGTCARRRSHSLTV